MRIPMPRLSEKKACPMARMMTCGVILEKSGCRKKESPSLEPGSVSERTQKTSSMTNSSGMSMFDIFSIPFCTPRDRII